MDRFNIPMRSNAWFVTVVPPFAIAGLLLLGAGRGPWTAIRIAGHRRNDSADDRANQLRATHAPSLHKPHPVYVFSALALAGIAFYFGMLRLLLLLAPLIPLQIVRARPEEQVLEGKFGEGYRTTWL